MYMFIILLIGTASAQFLRECIYSDDSCKKMIGCEYSKLNACLVRTEANAKDGYVVYNSYKTSINGDRVVYTTYHETDKCDCDEDDLVVDDSPLNKDECVEIRDGAMYKISTIVDSMIEDELKPIAYFVNMTYGFTNKPTCNKPTKFEALFGNCANFPNGQSALYRIHEGNVICDTFHDDQCLRFEKRLFEHPCNTCMAEKVDKAKYEYRNVMCGNEFLKQEAAQEKKEL